MSAAKKPKPKAKKKVAVKIYRPPRREHVRTQPETVRPHHRHVLTALRGAGKAGYTDDELSALVARVTPSSLRRHRKELVGLGLVAPTNMARPTARKRGVATVWVLTPQGRQAADKIRSSP